MPKISIIVPVYNTAPFLCQCLDSVCSQTLKDIEIICIDDCSTDGSSQILESYAEKDSRIRYIQQKANSGPGAARNVGLSIASGQYIGFVDSDDWIDENYFESLYSVAEARGADIVYNANIVKEMPESSEPLIWLGSPHVTENGFFISKEISANYTNPSMFAHLFRRPFLASIKCTCPVEYNIGEDIFFHIVSSMHADSIYAFAGPTYHYRKNKKSITNTISPFNVNTVRFYRDIVNYFGSGIYKSSFKLKLYNADLFSGICNERGFLEVKRYLESLSEYFDKSGVCLSDFDKYAIGNIIQSSSFEEMSKRIGREPWVRYTTMERIKNKMKVKISVIIPIYNTEQYVGRCLKSVCEQTFHNLEIICVNDCSTDRSLDMVKQVAVEDNRIQLIDLKENMGVSNARNTALKVARGEYVYFMDSDDWIDAGFLEEMYDKIKSQNADLVINSYYVKEYDDIKKNTVSSFDLVSAQGSWLSSKVMQVNFPPVVWARIFRKSFLDEHKITHPIVKCGAEDIAFSYSCDLTNVSVYAFRGHNAYHYYQRPTSAMHNPNRGFHYFEAFNYLVAYLRRNCISLDGIKLFYVESLIIDTEEKYNFVKNYLSSIDEQITTSASLYNEQEHFLVRIMKETQSYSQYVSLYNPNVALSFIKNKMTHRK